MSEITLTKEEETRASKLSKEVKVEFDKLSTEAQKAFLFESSLSSDVNGLETVSYNAASEEYPMIGVQTESNPLGLKAGRVIKAKLKGYVPMFSLEFKENWDEITYDGKTVYRSGHFKFENEKGEDFGIFAYGGLNLLRKIPTKSSDVAGITGVKADPTVAIKYVGLIEGREKLKSMGVEIKQGNSAHVFEIMTDKATTALVERYRFSKGIVNYLRSPEPKELTSSDEALDENMVAINNWHKLQHGNIDANAQIENTTQH